MRAGQLFPCPPGNPAPQQAHPRRAADSSRGSVLRLALLRLPGPPPGSPHTRRCLTQCNARSSRSRATCRRWCGAWGYQLLQRARLTPRRWMPAGLDRGRRPAPSAWDPLRGARRSLPVGHRASIRGRHTDLDRDPCPSDATRSRSWVRRSVRGEKSVCRQAHSSHRSIEPRPIPSAARLASLSPNRVLSHAIHRTLAAEYAPPSINTFIST